MKTIIVKEVKNGLAVPFYTKRTDNIPFYIGLAMIHRFGRQGIFHRKNEESGVIKGIGGSFSKRENRFEEQSEIEVHVFEE